MPARHTHDPARRAALIAGLFAVVGSAAPALAEISQQAVRPAQPAGPRRLRLLAYATTPHLQDVVGTPLGGLSAIDFDRRTGEYLLLSDDRSDRAPARFYTASWTAEPRTVPAWTSMTSLRQSDGALWPNRSHASPGVPVIDPEAMRWRPDTGTVLWSTEGDLPRGFGPALYESRRDGNLVREVALPAMFAAGDGRSRGPRDNMGFEGLALTPDARFAWLAMEAALCQDGPIPTVSAPGGPCRLTQIDLADGHAVRQIAYGPDAVPLRPLLPGTFADNGISEILMIDTHRMLVLERAYAAGTGNSLRIYEIDTRAASDTLAIDTLVAGNYRAAAKTLVADFATLGLPQLDNTEGMCWGPSQPGGKRTLVVVSDDNFNPTQITQFAAFEFTD